MVGWRVVCDEEERESEFFRVCLVPERQSRRLASGASCQTDARAVQRVEGLQRVPQGQGQVRCIGTLFVRSPHLPSSARSSPRVSPPVGVD